MIIRASKNCNITTCCLSAFYREISIICYFRLVSKWEVGTSSIINKEICLRQGSKSCNYGWIRKIYVRGWMDQSENARSLEQQQACQEQT